MPILYFSNIKYAIKISIQLNYNKMLLKISNNKKQKTAN